MTPTFRWVTSADFRAIVETYVAACEANPSAVLDPEVSMGLVTDPGTWVKRLRDATVATYVKAFRNSSTNLVGMAFSGDTPLGVFHVVLDSPTEATIHTFAFLREAWGEGTGTLALLWLETELLSRGVEEVRSVLAKDNLRGRAFLQSSPGYAPQAVLWVRHLPKAPPVRFDCGGTGETSDFGEDPVRVVPLKSKAPRKTSNKKATEVKKKTTKKRKENE